MLDKTNRNDLKNVVHIVIYDLFNIMGKKKLLKLFQVPPNTMIFKLLRNIGYNNTSNWRLKIKAFLYINF